MKLQLYISNIFNEIISKKSEAVFNYIESLNINYDSRIIVGQDILSDAPGVAIFSDRSWVSDYGSYFATRRLTFI